MCVSIFSTTFVRSTSHSKKNSARYHKCAGTAVAQWLRYCSTNRKVAGSIPACVSGFFIGIKSFRSHYGPGVDPATNRKEYQEYLLGVKSGRCVRLTTLPPSCAVVTKSGSLNFLEPSGPVQACNGTALPFYHKCARIHVKSQLILSDIKLKFNFLDRFPKNVQI